MLVFFIDSSGRATAKMLPRAVPRHFLPLETSARFSQAIVWGWGIDGYQTGPCPELNQLIAITHLEKWQIRAVSHAAAQNGRAEFRAAPHSLIRASGFAFFAPHKSCGTAQIQPVDWICGFAGAANRLLTSADGMVVLPG
jgi:hypothetical protein